MASLLGLLLCAFGLAWLLKVLLARRRIIAKACAPLPNGCAISADVREWWRHCDDHGKRQAGSSAWVAPEALGAPIYEPPSSYGEMIKQRLSQ